jgi:hypothetical protein
MKKYGMLTNDKQAYGVNNKRINFFPSGHVVTIHHDENGQTIFHDFSNPRWLYRVPSRCINTDIPQGTKHYYTFFGKRCLMQEEN